MSLTDILAAMEKAVAAWEAINAQADDIEVRGGASESIEETRQLASELEALIPSIESAQAEVERVWQLATAELPAAQAALAAAEANVEAYDEIEIRWGDVDDTRQDGMADSVVNWREWADEQEADDSAPEQLAARRVTFSAGY